MAVVLALDAGTTGVRAIAFDHFGQAVASAYVEFPQYFPRPGWVEHDPEQIWDAVVTTTAQVLRAVEQPVAAVGITDQRETTVVWDRRTGRPLHRAIVWQDRRTADMCRRLSDAGHLPLVRSRTGLVLDPYFSATKLAWLFGPGRLHPDANTAFGTVDSWLLWRLSGGHLHATDVTNASRTMLFDINRLAWDEELTDLFEIPTSVLPEVMPTSGRMGVTAADTIPGLAAGIPLSGVAGDQQAALFGQACFAPGMTKNTYGTGSFVLMNIGPTPPDPVDGLLTTVAWSVGDIRPDTTAYALEGAIFVTGAAVQWMRDGLGLITESSEIGPLAAGVSDSGGAYFVPALTGLGSPHWDARARGTMVGLSRGVGRAHIARAAVEAMAFQTADVVQAMTAVSGHPLSELRVDGGASVMDLLLQLQSDLLGVPVLRAAHPDTTALGAAYLAGLAEGVWGSTDEIAALWEPATRCDPDVQRGETLGAARAAWAEAVRRSVGWAD